MRKTVFLLVLSVLLLCTVSVMADSVWSPTDDWFFSTWSAEGDPACKSIERNLYTVAGKLGFAKAMETPVSNSIVEVYPNGTDLQIAFICGVGNEKWGTVRAVRNADEQTYTEDWEGKSGYIRMEDLEQTYDSISFIDDFSDELLPYKEEDFDPRNSEGFVIWVYPGSYARLFEGNQEFIDYMNFVYDGDYSPYDMEWVYTDLDGGKWVSMYLHKPYTVGWVYVDDPLRTDPIVFDNLSDAMQ